MKPVVIFGRGELAQLAHYYFTHDSERTVAGFVVDDAYADRDAFEGLPLVRSSDVVRAFPPASHDVFVAIGYSGLNRARRAKFDAMEALGYGFATYVSSRSVTWPDLRIGRNCLVMEGNTIQPFVTIGDDVIVWSGNLISHHCTVEDDVFVASHVVVSGGVRIGARSFLGVQATIREHVTIGSDCLVGASAVVLRDVPDGTAFLVEGTPPAALPARRLSGML